MPVRSTRLLSSLLLGLLLFPGQPAGPKPAQAADDDGTWSTILPPTITAGMFAFDSRRNRTFHYGAPGSARDEVWLRPIDGLPWSRVRIAEAGFPRGTGRLLYDPASDRILALVALSPQPLEVWAIDAGEPVAWTRLLPENAPPSVTGSAIAWDTRRNRWLVFGGAAHGNPSSNELWSLEARPDVAHWARIDSPGPEARSDGSAAYDSTSDRLFIIGGAAVQPGGGVLNPSSDVYEVALSEGAQWTLRSRGVPLSVNSSFTGVVDEPGRRLLVFGAPHDTIRALALDETHEWSRLAAPDRQRSQARFHTVSTLANGSSFVGWSSARWVVPFADARFDSSYETPGDSTLGTPNSFIVGRHPDRGTPLYIERYPHQIPRTPPASVWSLDDRVPARWRPLTVDGAPPPSLGEHGSTLDTRRGRWILLRPTPGTGEAEVWSIEFKPAPRWVRLDCQGTAPDVTRWASVVYDSRADRVLVVPGVGRGPTLTFADAWSLDLAKGNTWSRIEVVGRAPVGRVEALAAFDPRENRLVLYGGYQTGLPDSGTGGISLPEELRSGFRADLWTLSLGTEARWDSIAVVGDSLMTRSQGTLVHDAGRGTFLLAASDETALDVPFNPGGFQAYELTPGETSWKSRRFSGPREPISFAARRAVYVPERDRLFAVSTSADRTFVLDRTHPSRLVPIVVESAQGNGNGAHGPDVTAAFLTGTDFDPFAHTIVEATLDGVRGDALPGGRARRDVDGDGSAEAWFAFDRFALGPLDPGRTFELRARTGDDVTLVGFAAATAAANGPGRGRQDGASGIQPALAFAVRLEGSSHLGLTLPAECDVSLEVFAVNGRRVGALAPARFAAGQHRLELPGGARLAAGVYWARLRAGADLWTGRVVRVD